MPGRRLPRTVIALSLVSLLTDVSSEMIYPLVPTFLATVLGASALSVGAIEGTAESVAALLKYASGWWSDRLTRRKPLVVAGYLIASCLRPLIGLAQVGAHVFAIRVGDRIGKGVRTAPRDAMLADAVAPEMRGAAFGFHSSADHLGAVIGPLVAFALLQWGGFSMRSVFLLSAIPAALAMLVLVGWVREGRKGTEGKEMVTAGGAEGAMLFVGGPPRAEPSAESSAAPPSPPPPSPGPPSPGPSTRLGGRFAAYVAILLLFTLGNSTDAFLLLRARSLGVETAMIPVLWAALHIVKTLAAAPAGALSDRIGRRVLITTGWLVYAATYLGFAYANSAWSVWALFLVYGVYFGLTDGGAKALVADLVPAGALSDRIGRRVLITTGWLVYAATYLGFAYATGAWAVWALFLVYGVYFGLTDGGAKALVADLVPADARGRAFGWYNLALGIGALPASLLFGALWDAWGAPTAFMVGAAIATVAALLLPTVIPRHIAR